MKTILHKTTVSRMGDYSGVVFLPAMDDLSDLPDGELVAELDKKRNPANHRRYWSFINQTFDMQEDFDNVEQWRKYIQMKAGHYEAVVTPKGETMYWPKSISWESIEEGEFKQLFNQVVKAFLKYYGNALTNEQINQIVNY